MKKWIGALLFVCALLLCSMAAADREIPLTWDGQSIGTIKVPDDVHVYLETGTHEGIVCEDSGDGTKTLTMTGYDHKEPTSTSSSSNPKKVVILDMAYQNILSDKTAEPVLLLMPTFHTGTVQEEKKEGSARVLTIKSVGLIDPSRTEYREGENLVTEAVWNEYRTYISDENIDYTAMPLETEVGAPKQNIKLHLAGTAYTLDVYGNWKLVFHVKTHSETWWVHYTIDMDYDLRIDQLGIQTTTPSLSLGVPLGIGSVFCEVDGEGAAAIKFRNTVGFTFEFDLGLCRPEPKFTPRRTREGPELIGEATIGVFAGISIGPDVDVLGFISIGIGYKMGYHLEYHMYHGHYFYDDKPQYKWHACDDCRFLEIYPQLGPLSLDVTVIKVFSKSLDLYPEKKYPSVYEHYWSKTYGDDGEGRCPHIAYRLDVTVRDENGKALEGAEISYKPADETYFKPVISAKTDRDGEGTIYIPLTADQKENTVTVSASTQDPLDPKKKLSASRDVVEKGIPEGKEEPDPGELSLTIELKSVDIYFEDSGSGKTENMPSAIHYHPSQGKVRIPDNIPEKTGVHFTGWNTAADGTGTKVMPGSQVLFETDTVLYAQWELINRTYVVEFNANGGTSTSSTGAVVPLGQPLDITKEYAKWEHHNFLGWSRDREAFEAEFPAGQKNIITNDREEAVIELYAVWSFDPVNPPIRIHFDMNGGPDEQRPRDMWIDQNSWALIPPQRIYWDEIHLLQGWSTDPKAEEPSYFAARTYFFTDHMTLYAVWKVLPVCTLSFEDPAGNDAANMPESVLFVPDVSSSVSVPDTIPWKSGRVFHSWNTKEDGSGENIQPGAVIQLYRNTVLYAQWEVIGTRWMVIFNANGGEKAPIPQFAKKGENMMLTTAEASWTNHRFLGWSLSDDADMPDYPAGSGNVIPYSSEKDVVTLYAVWGFDPVDKPIRVSYDMNGGPQDQKPSDQWVPSGSWLVLSGRTPAWDGQHVFLGWSLSSRSRQAEYRAGATARFAEDTVLYAVWNISYHITEGNGSSWTEGASGDQGLRFKADGNLRYFRTLYVDGSPVPGQNYSLYSGSTVAVLSSRFLAGLEDGSHTIRFGYADGHADGTFNVYKPVPRTGDSSNPALWTVLILLGAAGITAIVVYRLSRRKK